LAEDATKYVRGKAIAPVKKAKNMAADFKE
jgi:hypothetical protein